MTGDTNKWKKSFTAQTQRSVKGEISISQWRENIIIFISHTDCPSIRWFYELTSKQVIYLLEGAGH